jgi:TonB family protein
MLPRALLFSSDAQTSTVLQRVLADLEIDLVHCREIFAAIEELTTRSFQAIVIDWRQELEASFLLNMSRELKSTRDTYSLVIVDAGLARVLTINPDGFLERPFTPEEARQAILRAPGLRKVAGQGEQNTALPASTYLFENSEPAREIALPHFAKDDSNSSHGRWEVLLTAEAKRVTVGDAARRHGFLRPEASVRKKAAALVCLLTLLVAVVHGEEQLGYLPHGLLSYRNLSDLMFSTEKQGTRPQATNRSTPDADSTAQLSAADANEQANNKYFINLSPRVAVRPLGREGNPSQSRQLSALSELVAAGSSAIPTEISLPNGANPLIPSSLYISPQRLSGPQRTVKLGLAPTNWTAGIIAVPEEASRSLLVHQVSPNYPLEALRAGLQGPVVFQALVGRDGTIEDLKLVRGYFALGLAAVEAVKQWRFRPYRVNGEIVQMQTFLTVNFPNSNEMGKPNSNGSLMTYGGWR